MTKNYVKSWRIGQRSRPPKSSIRPLTGTGLKRYTRPFFRRVLDETHPTGPGNTAEVQSEVILDAVEEPHVGYSTDPPTSGPRVTEFAVAGHRTDTLRDEIQVANLHNGYVIVHYNPTAPSIIASEMRQLAAEFEGSRVIVQPDTTLPSTIAVALTAWGQIENLEEYDKGRIYRFIHHFESAVVQYADPNQSNQTQNARTGG